MSLPPDRPNEQPITSSFRSEDELAETCLPLEAWLRVAAGTLPEVEAMACLRHAGACSRCSALLHEASSLLAEDTTLEEEESLDRLTTSTRDGQMRLAERLSYRLSISPKADAQKAAKRSKLLFWPIRALAAAAGLLVAFFVYRSLRPVPNTTLLARAYDKHRLSDLRIPGSLAVALASPTRGRMPSDVSSSELLKVKLRSQQEFEKNPNDPSLRQTLGRIAIVEHDGETARRQFEMAEALDPHLPGLKFDLGTAYFEIAESTGKSLEYAHAIDFFGQYLHDVHQQDAVALFDQGLCWERENVDAEAAKDFEAALALEKNAGWRQEIERHLKALKARDAPGASGPGAAGLTPASFLALHSESPGEFEAYLDVSRNWLPHRDEDPETATALRQLAAMGTRHGDAWLSDMLKLPLTPTEADAERTLAASLEASAKGNADQALAAATAAVELFTQAGNRPGQLRARAERAYSLQNMGREKECLSEALPIIQSGALTRYAWQRIYLQLDVASCQAAQGEIDEALRKAQDSLTLAKRFGLAKSDLRATGFVTSYSLYQGHVVAAWSTASSTLAKCYAIPASGSRRYQLLYNLELAAKALDLPWTEVGLASAAAQAASANNNPRSAAYAFEALALTQLKVGLDAEAASSFNYADQMLAKLGPGPAAALYGADWKTDRAALLARVQGTQAALQSLAAQQAVLQKTEAFVPRIHFYTEYAELLLDSHRPQESAKEVQGAVDYAERRFPSVHTEQERRAWAETAGPAYHLLALALADTGQSEAALRSWEWFRTAPFRTDRKPTTPDAAMSPEQLPSLPRPRAGVLTLIYARVRQQYIAWSISDNPRESIRLRILPAATSTIDGQARAFSRLCEDPASSKEDIAVLGRVLYQGLLSPFQDQIDRAQYVQLDLDSSLSKIPFAALVDGNHFFGLEHPLIFLPPWWTLDGIGREESAAIRQTLPDHARLLVMRESSSDPAARIPAEYDESKDIAARFPQAQMQSASLHYSASALTAFGNPSLRSALGDADIIHYTGHGLEEDSTNPSSDPPGQTPVAIAPGLLKHCSLAVLSACRTLGEREDSLEDDLSFERIVLSSGATHVVGTQWDVDSAMTRKLMVRFYAELAGHQTFPEALRRAQQALQAEPASSHPYFWSAFQLVGQ
jgi:CHAT domain-containing protein